MKQIPFLILAVWASSSPVHSEDMKDPHPEETAVAPTTARILGSIPDGTPPPPEPPKPKFIVPTKDVLETKSVEQGGRTITLRKINPIALPPPEPSSMRTTTDSAPTRNIWQAPIA